MKITGIWKGIRDNLTSFFDQVARTSEKCYLILLTAYVTIFAIFKVWWLENVETQMGYVRYGIISVIMWGSAIYLIYVIAEWKKLWKKTGWLVLVAVVLLGAVFGFSRIMSTNSYTVVMDVFFCLMAAGKNYKRILRCMFGAIVGVLLVAAIGVPLNFTADVEKPDNISPGHSLGINYPNTWGYMVFAVLLIAWYLWIRRKPIITLIVFWITALFMYFYISCRTIALLTAVFPFPAFVVNWLSDRPVKPRENVGVLGWAITAIPFMAFAFMMFASMNYVWVHDHFYYTKLHTMAMRFVQGGLYFFKFGLPIFGNPYRSNVHTFVNVSNDFVEVGILDSSFAAYIIMRGMVWLGYTLIWLCIAHYKAVKRSDYAIPFLSTIILVFAMMERPGLDMWYNFILLYPLAKIADDPQERIYAKAQKA